MPVSFLSGPKNCEDGKCAGGGCYAIATTVSLATIVLLVVYLAMIVFYNICEENYRQLESEIEKFPLTENRQRVSNDVAKWRKTARGERMKLHIHLPVVAITGAIVAYILWMHCKRCNGMSGFAKGMCVLLAVELMLELTVPVFTHQKINEAHRRMHVEERKATLRQAAP